jgi:hypothetical protein
MQLEVDDEAKPKDITVDSIKSIDETPEQQDD